MNRQELAVGSPQSSGRPLAPRFLSPVPCHAARRRLEAFTMIELLVVIAIIAILAGLTLSTLGYVNKKGAESRARAEVAALSSAIDSFFADFGAYPASNNLFRELTGHSSATINTNRKVYFEPTPTITTNMTNGPFIDPWGTAYNYNPTNPSRNRGFFDLWTTNNAPRDSTQWIYN